MVSHTDSDSRPATSVSACPILECTRNGRDNSEDGAPPSVTTEWIAYSSVVHDFKASALLLRPQRKVQYPCILNRQPLQIAEFT